MSKLTLAQLVLGISVDDLKNFLLDTDLAGALRLRRKSDGTGGNLATFSSTGVLDVPGGVTAPSFLSPMLNLTGAPADVTLLPGQLAYHDFTAVTSLALRIATADSQSYELTFMNLGNTGSTGNTVLSPNNTSYTNFFKSDVIVESGSSVSSNANYHAGLLLGYGSEPRTISAVAYTRTVSKVLKSSATGYTGSQTYLAILNSFWQAAASSSGAGDTTTAWTSLGTVTFPVAATGRVMIRRLF